MNVAKMTVEELNSIVSQNQVAWENFNAARNEVVKRQQEEEEAEKNKVFTTKEMKKLLAKYKKTKAAINAYPSEQKIEFLIPVTFTLDTDILEPGIYGKMDVGDFFENKVASGSIGKVKGITDGQLRLLQEGLDNVVDGACSEINCLFLKATDHQQSLINALNEVIAKFQAAGVEIDDFLFEKI